MNVEYLCLRYRLLATPQFGFCTLLQYPLYALKMKKIISFYTFLFCLNRQDFFCDKHLSANTNNGTDTHRSYLSRTSLARCMYQQPKYDCVS